MDDRKQKLYDMLDKMKVSEEQKSLIEEIKNHIEFDETDLAMQKLKIIKNQEDQEQPEEDEDKENEKENIDIYPPELQDEKLEQIYLGMLLNNPKSISMYYFLYEECLFSNNRFLDVYKSVLFTDGAKYSSEIAKASFSFAKATKELYELKDELKSALKNKHYNFEQIYIDLKKLFKLRKIYNRTPLKDTQNKIAEIRNYALYKEMSVEEIDGAIEQITITSKFKKAVLNAGTTEFLLSGDNTLTTGLDMPFPILTSVFKGIRKGETMAFAMPSNSGKSRFTLNLASYIAFKHKKKVLIISNEMSEEKMKLCLITTILNNPEIQKLHGQELNVSESALLEFKFRPDEPEKVEVDEDGFVLQQKDENRKQFIERLKKVSTEFNKVIKATEWANKEINNSMYFVNITDHTNDELQKVINNYYYKEKIEYMFYDTMKTDTQNIGNSTEIKKTATIISNLAQNLNIFIGYTMQITETPTLPINLTINDLSESRTVKEVLDTLCLIKQIDNRNLKDYEYSLEEVSDEHYNLKEYRDPDERYYACVVDKNRSGSKPKILFNLNLAYNRWVELGYLKLKEY